MRLFITVLIAHCLSAPIDLTSRELWAQRPKIDSAVAKNLRDLGRDTLLSRYLPEQFLSTDKHNPRAEAIRFGEYFRVRDKMRHGTATASDRAAYTKERTADLAARLALFQALGARKSRFANTQMRRTQDQLIALKAGRMANAITSHRRPPKARNRVICRRSEDGFIGCATEKALTEFFLHGQWKGKDWVPDAFAPAKAYQVLYKIDDIATQISALNKNTLLNCYETSWVGVNTTGSADSGDMPTPGELSILSDACRSAQGTSSSGPSLSGETGSLASATERAETEARACGGGNETVMGGLIQAGGSDVISGLLGALGVVMDRASLYGFIFTLEDDGGGPAERERRAEEAKLEAMANAVTPETAQRELDELASATDALETAAAAARAEAKRLEIVAANETDAKKKEDAAKKAAAAKKKADDLDAEALCYKKYGKSCKEHEEAQKKAQQGTSASGSASDGPEGGVNCAATLAAAAWFKMQCSGLQDQPGSVCNEFKRRFSGCVSSWRITPTPEEDKTCPNRRVSTEAAVKQACEDRASVSSPLEQMDVDCARRRAGVRVDLQQGACNDPAAMPPPDMDCTKQRLQTANLFSSGQVRNMAVSLDSSIGLFDALKVGGLGLMRARNQNARE